MEKFKSRRDRAKQEGAALRDKSGIAKKKENAVADPKRVAWYKNKKIILAVVIIVAFALGISAFLLLRSTSDKVQYSIDQSRQQIRDGTSAIGAEDNKGAKLSQLADALNPVPCRVGFIPAVGEVGEQCKSYNESTAAYRESIEILQQLLEYDKYVKDALSKVSTDSEVSDYKAEQSRLEKVKHSLDEAPHSDLVGKPHDDIKASIASIATHWGRLSETSSEKNEEKYKKANKELTDTYAVLQKNASELMHVYDVHQHTAYESYELTVK